MPRLDLNPTAAFRGFGEAKQGRAYFMSGMEQGLYGASARLSNVSVADDGSLTVSVAGVSSGVGEVYGFANGAISSANRLFAIDANGSLWARPLSGDTWSIFYKFIETFAGAGIVGGDDRKLYIVGNRYLAQFDTEQDPYSTGTISVTNGSPNVTGSGTAFNSGFIAPVRIVIGGVWYTVSTITDATHIVLSTNYAGSTASGLAFQAYKTADYAEKFQDFGATNELTDNPAFQWAQPFSYEGDLLIPRKWQLCRYNADGSWNGTSNAAFTLPTSLNIISAARGSTGILIGANQLHGTKSYLVLWDNFSTRSTAPWIPLNDQILSVKAYESGWIVVTEHRVIYTNGYSMRTLSNAIDTRFGEKAFGAFPNGVTVIDKRVIICNQYAGYARKRAGIYIYHIDEDTYEFVPILDKYGYNVTPNAVFIDPDQKVNISATTAMPAKKLLTKLAASAPANASLITQPLGASPNTKHVDSIKVDLAILEGNETITADISMKVAPLNRRLWGLQKAKTAGANTTHIVVDGTTLGDVQIGDEIIILEGANAGLSRHISAITGQGTSTETWTLDTALTAVIEQDCYINITPFQKVDTKTVSNATQLRDVFFDVRNRYKGKKFLAKLMFSNLSTPIEVLDIALVTSDQKLAS